MSRRAGISYARPEKGIDAMAMLMLPHDASAHPVAEDLQSAGLSLIYASCLPTTCNYD